MPEDTLDPIFPDISEMDRAFSRVTLSKPLSSPPPLDGEWITLFRTED